MGADTTFGRVIPGITSVTAPVFTAGESFPLVLTLVMPARGVTSDWDVSRLSAAPRCPTRAVPEFLGHSVERDGG